MAIRDDIEKCLVITRMYHPDGYFLSQEDSDEIRRYRDPKAPLVSGLSDHVLVQMGIKTE